MQAKQRLATGFDDVVERPRIAPTIKARRKVNIVESRGYIHDYPEDEPEAGPRLADDHGDVLAGEAERYHAPEIDHPVYDESCASVGVEVCVAADDRGDGRVRHGIAAGEVDPKGKR